MRVRGIDFRHLEIRQQPELGKTVRSIRQQILPRQS